MVFPEEGDAGRHLPFAWRSSQALGGGLAAAGAETGLLLQAGVMRAKPACACVCVSRCPEKENVKSSVVALVAVVAAFQGNNRH